jgi:uncharacterized protein involved in outer membrane biogenesis
MSLRRFLLTVGLVLLALVLGLCLYVAFGDLSRHKSLIEELITERSGRSFQITGPFALEILPAVSVVAENVRLGNAEWGTEQPMVHIGRFATVIDLWSLISGPVRIRSLELSDVAVLLEKDAEGNANWVLRDPTRAEPPQKHPGPGMTELPAVIESGLLSKLRVTYRQPGRTDRVAVLNSLSIGQGTGGLLAMSGNGSLNEYALALEGEIGPIDALVAGRDIRMDVEGSIGNLQLDVGGGIGRLYPLDGADLSLELRSPDVGAALGLLELPVVAQGAMEATAKLSDAGERTALDADATLGDIKANVKGTLSMLGLTDSDLEFSATAGDLARLGAVFGVEGLPREELRLAGRVMTSQDEIGLRGFIAQLPGAEVKLDGTVPRSANGASTLRFEAAVDSIARLKPELPEIGARAAGTFARKRGGFELKDLKLRLDQNELVGEVAARLTGRTRVDARLSSQRLDLTAFTRGQPEQQGGGESSGSAGKKGKSKRTFVFRDQPLPLEKLQRTDGQLQLTLAELVLDKGSLTDVSGDLQLDQGSTTLRFRATGLGAGQIDADMSLVPSQRGADLTMNVRIHGLRAGLLAPEGSDPGKSPPTNLDANIKASGASPRQMASGANGKIVFTQGKGRVKRGALDILGSGILSQIGGQLNPFSAEDPYTKLECTAAKIKIVDGQAKVDPVLMQSDKVTVTAKGSVDLRTEEIAFDFNTRPREGIGISPGMFTNPFIQLGGTLVSPRIATGAKGVVSGALAVGTAGISVVAKGLVDRVAGQADLCASTLAEVSGSSQPASASADGKGDQK